MSKENGTSGQWIFNRDMLIAKRNELLANLRDELQTVGPTSGVGEDDLSQALQDQFVAIQLKRIDYFQLKMIDAALARLEGQEAGMCVDCGKPISTNRLMAIPWASRCISCQESQGSKDS